MNEGMLRNYANLVVTRGVNLKENQTAVITSDLSNAYFARILADIAYDHGAREVVLSWSDEYLTREKYLRAKDCVFDEYPSWMKEFYTFNDQKDPVYISVISPDPDLLKGVDPSRMQRISKLAQLANEKHSDLLMSSNIRWCVTAVPSMKWAKRVFPDLPDAEAFEKLWEAIAVSARLDNDDPVGEWERHNETFAAKLKYLNDSQFESLHYTNSLGTDVVIRLPENHIWGGGGELDKKGVFFFPNIPTEEIFTLPHKDGVDGKIVSSIPLIYHGNEIEGIELEYKNGRVESFKARKNEEILKSIIETDEGSHRLGEVALVPFDSPISKMNLLFYNTLFDENASCHFAIGKAYSSCLKGDDQMSKEELAACGWNDSLVHVDFMVGTADLSIKAKKKNGEVVDLFIDGNYVKA